MASGTKSRGLIVTIIGTLRRKPNSDKPLHPQERPAKNPEAGYVLFLGILLAVSLSSILWPRPEIPRLLFSAVVF